MLGKFFTTNNKGLQVKTAVSPEKKAYYEFIKQNLYLSSFNSTYRYEPENKAILQWRVEAHDLNLPKSQKELNIKLLNLINSNNILGLRGLLYNNKNNEDLKAVLDLKRGKSELTLLHVLCMNHDYSLADDVLKAGANPNIQDCEGKTPLHYVPDRKEFVDLLIKNKADPNIQDNAKRTSLHYCANNAYPDSETISCVNMLVENGAKVNVIDNDKKTPAQIAVDADFYDAECFFNENQKTLYEELYRMINNTYEFIDYKSPPIIKNQNVESLKKFLDQNKDKEDLRIVLSNRNEEGDIKVLETLSKDSVCADVRKLVEKAAGVKEKVYEKATQNSLFDAYLKQQHKIKLKFVNELSQIKNMTELQKYINDAIDSGIMLNFFCWNQSWEETNGLQIYLLDSVIAKISELEKNSKEENLEVANDIICKLILRGALLGNKNSLAIFDKQVLKHGKHVSNIIKAYDKHTDSNQEFVKIAEGAATSGKLNSAIIDNTTFYLEYSKDSKIDVAKIIDGVKSLGLVNRGIACGKDIIKIGKSEVEVETCNDNRNYTDLADGSDIILTFCTSAGKLEVRLYTDTKSKDLVKVEVIDKEILAKIKDCNEKIGINCLLGGLSVNEAIDKGFFVRSGKFQIPEVIHSYQKPSKEKQEDKKQWQDHVKPQKQQEIPVEGERKNNEQWRNVVKQQTEQTISK